MSSPADHAPLKKVPKAPPVPIPSSSYVFTFQRFSALNSPITTRAIFQMGHV